MALKPDHRIAIDNKEHLVRYVGATTKRGVALSLWMCRQGAVRSHLSQAQRDPFLGCSAKITLGFGRNTPNRVPFSLLRNNSGWLRILLSQPDSTFPLACCSAIVFDDSGQSHRFDLLEYFFETILDITPIANSPLSLQHRFASVEIEQRPEILAMWNGLRYSLHHPQQRRIDSELWHLRREIREAEDRISVLRKQRRTASASANAPTTASIDCPPHALPPDDDVDDCRRQQAHLRQLLCDLEERELSLLQERTLITREPILDWKIRPLATVRWTIISDESTRFRHTQADRRQ